MVRPSFCSPYPMRPYWWVSSLGRAITCTIHFWQRIAPSVFIPDPPQTQLTLSLLLVLASYFIQLHPTSSFAFLAAGFGIKQPPKSNTAGESHKQTSQPGYIFLGPPPLPPIGACPAAACRGMSQNGGGAPPPTASRPGGPMAGRPLGFL